MAVLDASLFQPPYLDDIVTCALILLKYCLEGTSILFINVKTEQNGSNVEIECFHQLHFWVRIDLCNLLIHHLSGAYGSTLSCSIFILFHIAEDRRYKGESSAEEESQLQPSTGYGTKIMRNYEIKAILIQIYCDAA